MNKTIIIVTMMTIITMASVSASINQSRLMFWYDLDYNPILDATGNTTATITGTPRFNESGKVNQSVNFTAIGSSNNYIRTNYVPSSNTTNNSTYTWGGWVYLNSTPTGAHTILSSDLAQRSIEVGNNNNIGGSVNTFYCLGHNATAQRVISAGNNTATDKVKVWTQVLCTWDGSSLKIYINGTFVNNVSAGGPIRTASSFMTIGQNGDASNTRPNFNGDMMFLFNRVLSDGEISELYNVTSIGISYPFIIPIVNTTISQNNYNFSSGYNQYDQLGWRYNLSYNAVTNDNTPTVIIGTNQVDNCSISTCNYNYTSNSACGNYAECTERTSTTHTCTIPTNLTTTNSSLYLTCTKQGEGITSALSGSLNVTLLGLISSNPTLPSCISLQSGCSYSIVGSCGYISTT